MVFTTFEVVFEKQHKRLDLVSGSIVEYDPNAYVEIHTQTAIRPEYTNAVAAAPRFDGEFSCVFASVGKAELYQHWQVRNADCARRSCRSV